MALSCAQWSVKRFQHIALQQQQIQQTLAQTLLWYYFSNEIIFSYKILPTLDKRRAVGRNWLVEYLHKQNVILMRLNVRWVRIKVYNIIYIHRSVKQRDGHRIVTLFHIRLPLYRLRRIPLKAHKSFKFSTAPVYPWNIHTIRAICHVVQTALRSTQASWA